MIFNKKSTITIIISIIFSFFILNAIFLYIIDPYNEFDSKSIKFINEIKGTNSQTKWMANIDSLMNDTNTLVFGTSRTEAIGGQSNIDKKIKIINLSQLARSNPKDVFNVLNYMDKNGFLRNIKSIVYEVDILEMSKSMRSEKVLMLRFKYPKLTYYLSRINKLLPRKENINIAIKTIKTNMEQNKQINKYVDERMIFYRKHNVMKDPPRKEDIKNLFTYDISEEQMKFLKRIKEFGIKKNINIKFFTSPFSIWEVNNIGYEKLEKYHKSIFQSVGSYYNFSIINSITTDKFYFHDWMHPNKNFHEMMVDVLLNDITDTREIYKIINNKFGLHKYLEELKNDNLLYN